MEPKRTLDFFWHHLERDFDILCKAVGKCSDETALLVHLIVKRILTVNPVVDGKSINIIFLLVCVSSRIAGSVVMVGLGEPKPHLHIPFKTLCKLVYVKLISCKCT